MDKNIASAIIGEGGSILGTALQAITANRAQKKQFEYNSKLMDKQNALNIANWQMQNEYNTPANQVARLRSAGLNPDLFYGQTSASTLGGELAPSSGSSVGGQSPINTDFGQSTLQARQLELQEKLINSQAAKNYADANQTNKLTPWVTESIKSTLALNEANAKLLNENVEKIRSETELLKWQARISRNESQISDALKDSTISTRLKELGASEKQAEIITNSFAELYSAQIKLAIAQSYASYVQSDAAAANAQANQMNARTNRMQQQLDAIIRRGELAVKQGQYRLDKAMNEAGIHNVQLQNEWREMLKEVPVLGEAIHGLLSIPGAWFSGVSVFKPR